MENEKKLKILILEDNQDDVLLIEHILRKDQLSFIYENVDTRDEFEESIHRFKPDVILSDHGLPGFNSHEALKICIKKKLMASFILVTGTVSDEYAISCLREGADDYILKSNLSRLPTAVRSAIKKRRLEKMKREARHALRKQNEELLKVNKELDNFVYSVSHNLRGPLASVMGLLNVAKSMNKEQQLASIHEMMTSSVNKLDDTLQEIIEYSKNARMEIHPSEINFKRIVENAFEKLTYLFDIKQITKHINIENEVSFFSDDRRLCSIFNNILSNAITYRNKGRELIVDIQIRTTDQDAIISVRDNGSGIRENTLPKVFNMFFRGSPDSKGAGLGLYIVKEIISKLQGQVQILSTAGEGTTVILTIPNMKLVEQKMEVHAFS